ncbi:hypothetical protein QL285_066951 [Trifolium repens]|nr:hypothetical protein QL285_066951 [Trifolium repens]
MIMKLDLNDNTIDGTDESSSRIHGVERNTDRVEMSQEERVIIYFDSVSDGETPESRKREFGMRKMVKAG